MTSEAYHEPLDKMSEFTKDMHRAITSLMEELEAVDWYQQRVDATQDVDLKAILAHNRDEEKEHAAMVLEWIRRRDPKFDAELREWLFTDRPLAHAAEAEATEKTADAGEEEPHTPRREMSVGSLRGGR